MLEIILCPECGGALQLAEGATLSTVTYAEGDREEVKTGSVLCACGRSYPVADYVLSLAGLFPPVLQQEAAFWDRFYLWLLEQGSYGFHDLRLGQAPYITSGVTEPFPAADTIDRYDVHHRIAEHPLMRQGRTLLDIGVGLGWTSLYFARAGYAVTAFEPSLGPVTAAKRYAIGQGIFIEYICAAMGHIAFRPAGFDNVTAFHSLHHVPDLEAALREIRTWLRPDGAFALDEHVGNSKLAGAIGAEVQKWADSEVLPAYRTLSPEAMAGLPQEPHSALEDSSVDRVVPLVSRLFDVRLMGSRHTFLDHYPLLHYLQQNKDLDAYRHALTIANQLQELVRRADPEGGDYITIVAQNTGVDSLPEEPAPEQPAAPPTDTPEPRHEEDVAASLHSRIADLEQELTRQGAWAHSLEQELTRKDGEISRLHRTIYRLQNTRLRRLLHLLRVRRSKEHR